MNEEKGQEMERLGPTILTIGPLIKRCTTYIKGCWSEADGGCPSDSPSGPAESAKSNTWSTASWVYALQLFDDACSAQVHKGLDWLRESQNDNGSWPIFAENKNSGGEEYTVCTANAILAIQEGLKRGVRSANTAEKGRLQRALRWIIEDSARYQIADGQEVCSWPTTPAGEKTYTVETCQVAIALANIRDFCTQQNEFADLIPQLNRAITGVVAWLQLSYKELVPGLGGWGTTFDDPEIRDYPTALALEALDVCGGVLDASRSKKAVTFLKSMVREDGSLPSFVEFKIVVHKGLGMEQAVPYYSAPLVLGMILTKDPKCLFETRILDCLLWLINQANDGIVRLDINPQVTVWPTRDWALGMYRVSRIISPIWLEEIVRDHFHLRNSLKTSQTKLKDIDKYIDFQVKNSFNKSLLVIQFLVPAVILLTGFLIRSIFELDLPRSAVVIAVAGTLSSLAAGIVQSLKKST